MTILGLPLRVVRAIVTVVVALDLVALAAFAFHTTTTVTKTVTPLSASAPDTPGVPAQPPSSTGDPVPPVSVPISTGTTNTATGTTTQHHPTSTQHPTRPVTPPSHKLPPVQQTAIGKCPVKLATPKDEGGLQSLVPLAPAFGPFSAEAFASASAYQPELELIGPILAQYPKLAPKVAPLMTPLLKAFGAGSNQLFTLISPVYTSHRTAVLQSETQLATFFAPYSEKLAGQPLSGCVVDLEAALVGDTKSADTKSGSTAKKVAQSKIAARKVALPAALTKLFS